MIKEFLLKSSIKLVIASHHRGLFVSTNTAAAAAAAAKSLQSCPTLCDPTDRSPPGSPVPGILLARTLEWVAISFSSLQTQNGPNVTSPISCKTHFKGSQNRKLK